MICNIFVYFLLFQAGHTVTVYERNDRIGGLLRYGIPSMKLSKQVGFEDFDIFKIMSRDKYFYSFVFYHKFHINFHSYCPSYLRFSTLLATACFYFILYLALHLCILSNHLIILSSYHCGSFPSGCFLSLGYHLITAWVHLLSVNIICLAQ